VAGEGQWGRLLQEHSRSGLSLREFARRKGLSTNTLGYWKYKRRVSTAAPAPEIVLVKAIDDPVGVGGELTLELGGARLRIPPGCDLERVARVVSILRRSC
jgi:hypothetical protein